MAVKDALLALLAGGPCHGYQLKADFDAATGAAWPLNVGQVYSTLQRLERDGLVATDGDPDSDGRQAYRITADGREALHAWMAEPIAQPLATRDEVSMKVLVALATAVVPALEVVSAQRLAAMRTLQSLTALKADSAGEAMAWRLNLDRMVMLAEAEIRWLDLVEDRLEADGQIRVDHRPRATIGRAESSKPNADRSIQKESSL